jgi:hypothetical protein
MGSDGEGEILSEYSECVISRSLGCYSCRKLWKLVNGAGNTLGCGGS